MPMDQEWARQVCLTQNVTMDNLQKLFDFHLDKLSNYPSIKGRSDRYKGQRVKSIIDAYFSNLHREVAKKFDWKKCRELLLVKLNITWKAIQICPICRKGRPVKNMHCHHLIPKGLAPHLTYDVNNLVFLCKQCHNAIHQVIGGTY